MKHKFKDIKITCETCGETFISKVGPRVKTCSKKCYKIRRNKYIQKLGRKDFEHAIKIILYNSKARARRNRLKYNIDYKYLLNLFNKQHGKCAITKIKLEIGSGKGIKNRSPWSISIDRINNLKGYTKGNVQLVTVIYNMCKNTWTHRDVIIFSKHINN